MDLSLTYFKNLPKYDEALRRNQNTAFNQEAILIAKQQRHHYICEIIHFAIYKQDFSLIVDDIATFLDVDEKYVRLNILPHLDYITLPSGASEAFTPSNHPNMSFVDLRIRRWKKILINQQSFQRYLTEHLFFCIPFSQLQLDDVLHQRHFSHASHYEYPYQSQLFPDLKLIRKCNIAHLVEVRKRDDFIRKTKNDITHARELGLIDAERLTQEITLLYNYAPTMPLPVHNQEIAKFISKKTHYKLHLYKNPVTDQRPTVLYWFPS